jgi:hypothetical protein
MSGKPNPRELKELAIKTNINYALAGKFRVFNEALVVHL